MLFRSARIAAIRGIAGHMQGQWKQLHDVFFEHQSNLTEAKIDELVSKAGLDMARLKKDAAAAERIVNDDRREGDTAEIEGTPTFFVNGRMVEFEDIEAAIKAELGKK